MLLDKFSLTDRKHFKHDFFLVMKAAFELDHEFANVSEEVYRNLPIFEDCVNLFNKKYGPGIKVEVKQSYTEFRVNIFLKANTLKDLFLECCFQISGLKSIGDDHSNIEELQDKEAILDELNKIKNILYLHYAGYNEGTVILRDRQDCTQLCYSKDNLLNELEPEYQMCAYYALKEGYDNTVDLSKYQNKFIFMSTSSDKRREPQ